MSNDTKGLEDLSFTVETEQGEFIAVELEDAKKAILDAKIEVLAGMQFHIGSAYDGNTPGYYTRISRDLAKLKEEREKL